MLQKEAVSPETLELLMRLMEDKELERFFLVGGTALALQIGHRFVDIAFLSSHMPLSLMLDAYTKKYSTRNPVMVLKALDYHKDIDFNEPIRIIKGKYSWEIIKERLSQMLDHPYTLLEELKMEG